MFRQAEVRQHPLHGSFHCWGECALLMAWSCHPTSLAALPYLKPLIPAKATADVKHQALWSRD